jgi:hypothetical protein
MNQDTSIDWGNVAQWAGAISTLLAVLTALFKESYIRWRRRPVLNITITPERPDCEKTKYTLTYSKLQLTSHPVSAFGPQGAQGVVTTSDEISADCYYLRLLVENKGKTSAERVQVFAAKLLKKQDDSTFRKVRGFLPMNLKWAHSHETYADVIHPGMCKHCNLGHVIDPFDRHGFPGEEVLTEASSDKTILSLDLEVQTNTRSHLIVPGVYKLELKVAGANCAPLTKVLDINITGEWFPGEQEMFSDGLVVK